MSRITANKTGSFPSTEGVPPLTFPIHSLITFEVVKLVSGAESDRQPAHGHVPLLTDCRCQKGRKADREIHII